MDTERQDRQENAKPPAAAKFRWRRFAFWLPWCLVHGGVVAWAAVQVERFAAPVLLFSLLVGLVLGATLVGMMRLSQVGNRSTILLGTVLAASVAVVGQHYVSYRIASREARDDAQTYRLAKLAYQDHVLGQSPVPPASFVQFLRWRAARGFPFLEYNVGGGIAWMIWAGDGLLVLAATLALVVPALRRPYCDRCGSWFVTTRRGPIDMGTARQLAALLPAGSPEEIASAGYRLVTCSGGCGPTGFELRLDRPIGSPSLAAVWLDIEQRNRIVETLDQGMADR